MNNIKLQNILSYLQKRNWTIHSEEDGFYKMLPPDDLDFEENALLYIAKNEESRSYQSQVEGVLGKDGIADIYKVDAEDLMLSLRNNGTILTCRLESSAFDKKAIGMTSFLQLTSSLNQILEVAAEYALKGNSAAVKAYVGHCNLVKLEVDKLLLKIELPSDLSIGLGEKKSVEAESVNEQLYDAFQFYQSKNEVDNKLVKGDLRFWRLQCVIDDFVQSSALKKMDFRFFNQDWEKEVCVGLKNENCLEAV
ncbi:MAG: hypothetical protein ACPG49_06245 [Chitinophagales bacterium]